MNHQSNDNSMSDFDAQDNQETYSPVDRGSIIPEIMKSKYAERKSNTVETPRQMEVPKRKNKTAEINRA